MKMLLSSSSSLLSLLLLLFIATNCGCKANTNDVGEDGASCVADSDDSLRRRVVRVGTKLNDDARFPLTFEGDWEKVIAAPEVHIIADANDVFFTEGPLVRHRRSNNHNHKMEKKDKRNNMKDKEKLHDDNTDESCSSSVLYASDTVRAVIYRISLSETNDDDDEYNVEVWATHTGGIDENDTNNNPQYENLAEKGSNGMATDVLDPRFVIINQHGLRRVVRCRLDDHAQGAPLRDCPDLQVITDSFRVVLDDQTTNNHMYNSPNDVVVHPHDGSIWFTDPIYGLLEKDRFCDEFPCHTGESYLDKKSEIGWQGVYRVDRSNYNRNNKLDTTTTTTTYSSELVTKYHRRPNGLALTPDAKRLWVADSTIGSPSWTAYDVTENYQGRYSPYFTSKATDVLTPAALGAILGRTENLPRLTGGEGTYEPTSTMIYFILYYSGRIYYLLYTTIASL
jgi:hypothetical protein